MERYFQENNLVSHRDDWENVRIVTVNRLKHFLEQHSIRDVIFFVNTKVRSDDFPFEILTVLIANIANRVPVDLKNEFLLICLLWSRRISGELVNFFAKEVSTISYRVTKLACTSGNSIKFCKFAQRLVELQGHDGRVTALSVDFLQLCVASRCYGLAVQSLRLSFPHIVDLRVGTLTSTEALKFFYYSGICFTACKDYQAAYDAFSVVVSMRASSNSSLALESLCKMKLLSLMINQVDVINNRTHLYSIFLNKYNHYEEIGNTFRQGDYGRLKELLEENKSSLDEQHNFGLAKKLLNVLVEKKIKNLQKIYRVVKLATVHASLNLGVQMNAEEILLSMVRRKIITVSIDQSEESNITFSSSPGVDTNQLLELGKLLIGLTLRSQHELQEEIKSIVRTIEYTAKSKMY